MSSFRARHGSPAGLAVAVPARAPARAPEVIVVTHDPELEDVLRQASPATPMRVATTPAALADLLMTGRAGALVLDVGALDSAALTVARHLAEQFPEVPLVAVGSREDEARLASLISRGLIYRFLHRPVSTARARTFVEAALRRSAEIGTGAQRPAARTPARPRQRPMFALAAAGGAATLALGFWLALRPPPASPEPAPRPAVAVAVAAAPVERAPPPVATPAPSDPAAVAEVIAREPAPAVRPAAAPAAPPVAARLPPATDAAPVASAAPVALAAPAGIAASEEGAAAPAAPASAVPEPPAQDLPDADAHAPDAG